MSKDRNSGKSVSYGRLVVFVSKHGENGLKRSYSKEQLQKLCRAANIPVVVKDNKGVLARRLPRALRREEGRFACSYYLDKLKVVIPQGNSDGRIIIRLQH